MKKAISFMLLLSMLAVCFAGCGNDASNSKNTLDVFDGVNILAFYGENGKGYVSFSYDCDYIDYDKTNQDIESFLKHIKLNYNRASNLSNGDSITVTLSYSHEDAQSLGISLAATSRTYTVYGLYDQATSVADAKELDANQIRSAVEKQLGKGETIVSAYVDDIEIETPRHICCVHVIVTDGSLYYTYEVGIDGKNATAVNKVVGRYRYKNCSSEEDVKNILASSKGATEKLF